MFIYFLKESYSKLKLKISQNIFYAKIILILSLDYLKIIVLTPENLVLQINDFILN